MEVGGTNGRGGGKAEKQLMLMWNLVRCHSADRGFVVGMGAHLWLLCGGVCPGKGPSGAAWKQAVGTRGSTASKWAMGLVWAQQELTGVRTLANACTFIQPKGGDCTVNVEQRQCPPRLAPQEQGRQIIWNRAWDGRHEPRAHSGSLPHVFAM